MELAKDKNGRIGRKIPGPGNQAKVAPAHRAAATRNVIVSQQSVVIDDAKQKLEEAKNIAKGQAKAAANLIKQKAAAIKHQKKVAEVEKLQKAGKQDPETEKLKNFFARKQTEAQTTAVLNSLIKANEPSVAVKKEQAQIVLAANPADFSSSGANPQYVRGAPMTGGQQWAADFRTQLVVGNPLTRDGVFGPNVTDYDRFVRGLDVNQTNVVNTTGKEVVYDLPIAGGTMVGRYDGQNIPAATPNMGALTDIWTGISTGVQSGFNQAVQQLPGQVSTAVTKEIQAMIDKGLARKNPDGTVTVIRETQAAPVIIQQPSSISPTMLLAGGLAGLGLVALILLRR